MQFEMYQEMLENQGMEQSTDMQADEFDRDVIYARLMAHNLHQMPNAHPLACMIASWYVDKSAMPPRLGLTPPVYQSLLEHYFPGSRLPTKPFDEVPVDFDRAPECEDLHQLFSSHVAGELTEEQRWMAEILVIGCMGSNHLWQDLGLWSRSDLSAFISQNFPLLAEKNDRNMKWKKFFYKQLCISEGIYVCRAPSCEVCADYQNCFNPEDD